MLRRLLLIPALAAGLALAGCGTTGGLPALPSSTTVDQTVATIQADVQSVCSFLPTIATVTAVIANLAGAGGVGDIAQTAVNGICGAVKAKAARLGGGPPKYRGVIIHGTFTKKGARYHRT